jgi:ribosomal protein S24E
MKVISDFRNELLKRRELSLSLNFESNPGFDNAKKIVAEEFKSVESLIVVTNVLSKYGSDLFQVKAYVYDTDAARKKILHNKEVKDSKKKESKKK